MSALSTAPPCPRSPPPSAQAARGRARGGARRREAARGGARRRDATLTVAGDLGPWDASPFTRAWLASKYSSAGYCKVESQSSVEGSPSTATATVRCYTATGAEIATPVVTATHLTSDAAGPC